MIKPPQSKNPSDNFERTHAFDKLESKTGVGQLIVYEPAARFFANTFTCPLRIYITYLNAC